MKTVTLILAAIISIFLWTPVFAGDEPTVAGDIELKNGDFISGEIVEETAEYITVEVMGVGGGFRKTLVKIPRSEIKTEEKMEKQGEPEGLLDVMLMAWENRSGKNTMLLLGLFPFIASAVLMFGLSLLFRGKPADAWKPTVAALAGWALPLVIAFGLYASLGNAALWLALAAALVPAYLLPVVFKENPLRALAYPFVHVGGVALGLYAASHFIA